MSAVWWAGDALLTCPYCLQLEKKLTLPFTSCNTWESRSCASSGLHSRADLVGGCIKVSRSKNMTVGDLTLLLICLMVAWWGRDALPHDALPHHYS